jgi:hypothetical protein
LLKRRARKLKKKKQNALNTFLNVDNHHQSILRNEFSILHRHHHLLNTNMSNSDRSSSTDSTDNHSREGAGVGGGADSDSFNNQTPPKYYKYSPNNLQENDFVEAAITSV